MYEGNGFFDEEGGDGEGYGDEGEGEEDGSPSVAFCDESADEGSDDGSEREDGGRKSDGLGELSS